MFAGRVAGGAGLGKRDVRCKGLTGGEYRIYANLADGSKRYVDICLTK
jgi:hypothetical protein